MFTANEKCQPIKKFVIKCIYLNIHEIVDELGLGQRLHVSLDVNNCQFVTIFPILT